MLQMQTFGYLMIKMGQNLTRTGRICDSDNLLLADFFDGRTYATREHHVFPRNGGWWQDVCNDWPKRPTDPFKSFFRMDRSSFTRLLGMLEPHITKASLVRKAIPADKRLAITLLWYAQGSTFRDIGEKFGVGYNTVSSIVKDVSKAICEHLVPNAIKFPQTVAEFDNLCQLAQNETRYPFPFFLRKLYGSHSQE
jgi:hypothetical protein